MHPAIIVGLVVLGYLTVTSAPSSSREREYEIPKVENRSAPETRKADEAVPASAMVNAPEESQGLADTFREPRRRENPRFEGSRDKQDRFDRDENKNRRGSNSVRGKNKDD